VLEDTYRPDAFRVEPFSWQLPDSPAAVQPVAGAALRRFRPNRAVAVTLENAQPAQLNGAELNGAVAETAGPYMASGNWWDEKTWDRQEWDAQLQNGVVCRFHMNGQAWELDGIYD
jgi:protein ImuB